MTNTRKTILELGPLLIFFVVHHYAGLIAATAALAGTTAIALLVFYVYQGRLPIMLCIGSGFVLVLGGLTIAFDNDIFIKMKPTLFSLSVAIALGLGLVFKRLFLKNLLESGFSLTNAGWTVLTRLWILYFIGLALVNEIVWRTTDTDTWVTFKVFGILPLTLLFAAVQTPIILRHQSEATAQE